MKNKQLKTIFHMDDSLVDLVYNDRFNNPYSIKLGIHTKKTATGHSYEMFTCLTSEMMLLSQKISSLTLKLERVINPIPPIAVKQFFTACLRDEIKATNDIEGIHSTRKEIDHALDQQFNPEAKRWYN